MKSITVKKFDIADAKSVQDLTKEVYRVAPYIYTPKPFTETELIEPKKSNAYDPQCFFTGLLDGKVVSLSNGSMEVNSDKGIIYRAYVHPEFRGNCYSVEPMLKCINHLRSKGAKEIQVNDWFDSPYREMIRHFEQQQIQVHHKGLLIRIDLRNCRWGPPEFPKGYLIRTFREGDDHTWAMLINAVLGGAVTSEEFWKQKFRGVSMNSDFDPKGFFFVEKGNETVGMYGVAVIHNRLKIAGTYIAGMGWLVVLPEHRRKGLGSALLIHSLHYLRSKGVSISEGWVHFYRKIPLKKRIKIFENVGYEIWYASFSLTFA